MSFILVLNLPKGFDCILLHLNPGGLKRFKKILKWFFLILLFLLVGIYIFIQTPFGQNWIAKQVTKRLSKDLQTRVSIAHVDFSLFNKMHLEGVLIEDRQGDTVLYAGDMKVRITDWFFFKKQAELKYVGLENAIIKFQRTDSVWRQQFLLDYFGSSGGSGKKKEGGLKLDLRKLELKNVSFLKRDGWMGEDMHIKVGSLDMDADKLSLSGNRFEVNSLLINNPVVAINKYDRRKPKKISTAAEIEAEVKRALGWNNHSVVKVGNLAIINGVFSTDRADKPRLDYFDGQHLLFTAINGKWSNARFEEDTVFATMQLSAKEKSGFEVKEMKADVKMTPQGMAFSDMEIKTNRSVIRNFYSMSYDDMDDLGAYISKVKMAAVFEDTYIDSDDIAFFAPKLANWKKKITLNGKVRGTVDNLSGTGLQVQAGNATMFAGDISMSGLPDIKQTFIDLRANDFRTVYADMVTIIPAMRRVTSPDLRKIQYLNFKGNFTGFIRDFVTFGTVQTNLGTLVTDINMKLPVGQEPLYSGNISTENFRLGEFLGDKTIGAVAFDAIVKGRGFNDQTRNTSIEGKIKFAEIKGYRYSNITVDGQLDKKMFEGVASIRDQNADLILNGVIDFNQKKPRFKLLADVTRADLLALGLMKDSLVFTGKADLDFTSNTIDNFLGTARISDATLHRNGRRLSFDSLNVTAGYNEAGMKTLAASSNEFRGTVSGNYALNELPAVVNYFLHQYYPESIAAPKKLTKDQSFDFDIETYYVDDYLQLISPKLAGFNNTTLKGRLDVSGGKLDMSLNVPHFSLAGYEFNFVNITASGDNDSLQLNGTTKTIRINDSLSIPTASFSIHSRKDTSRVSIHTGATQAVEKTDLHAMVMTYPDGVKIEFDSSSFTINSKTWTIEDNGELVIRSNTPATALLVLTEGDERILVKTQPSKNGKGSDVKVQLTDVNLADFAPYFLPKNRLEGLLTGNILVEDPAGSLKITSDDIQTRFLRLDNDSLGELKASLVYDDATRNLKVKGNTLNQENYLGFDANIFLNKEEAAKNLIALKAKSFQLDVLERFLGNLFTDIQGYLTGDVNISGPFDELTVTGKGRLKNAGLKVIFTQCYYDIQDTDIELTNTEIKLDGIILRDPITKNPIYLTGGIEHQSFKNMFYNLDISTRKPKSILETDNKPVQLLMTSLKDNKQFFGNVKGTGSMSLLGPQSNMYMKIDAVASETDSSFITLPPSTGRESGSADFLVERKYGREMDARDLRGSTSIVYDVDITVNKTPVPMVGVRIILDDLTGDEIKGKGYGALNIRSGTSEPLSLRGRFDIEEGSYMFTFQSFFKKPFDLRKGRENYIEWNGDPYDANVRFNAAYTAERVSFAPLREINSAVANAREDVYVIATLTDKLFKPVINFSLDFPNTSVAVNDPELALVFQQMQRNLNEINRQVTYLIVFNSFAPAGNSSNSTNLSSSALNVIASSTVSSISGLLFNEISQVVNSAFSKIFNSDNIGFNISGSLYNRNLLSQNSGFNPNQGQLDINIPISLFKDRFMVKVGSTLDLALDGGPAVQEALRLLPDVTLEWLINQSGSIRASFFYRENNDYLASTTTGSPGKAKRIGANISYRKDFDSLGDIFRKKKKKKVPEPEPVTEKQPVVAEPKKEEEE